MMKANARTNERGPGALWAVVQEWLDSMPYPPSERQLARKIGVSPTTIGSWKRGEAFPSPDGLRALAEEVGVPFERLLNGVLIDQGYRTAEKPPPARRSGRKGA